MFNINLRNAYLKEYESNPQAREFFDFKIIDAIRIHLNPLFQAIEAEFTLEFQALLQKIERAEKIGKNRIDRLTKEIEEWSEVLDAEANSRLFNLGTRTFGSLILEAANGFQLLDFVVEDKHSGLEVRNMLECFISGNFDLDSSLLNEEENEIWESTEKFRNIPFARQAQIFLKLCGISNSNFDTLRKFIMDIVLAHCQSIHLDRLVSYRDALLRENSTENVLKESPKKVLIGLPKLGKEEREKTDGITSLSRVQTAILVKMLRKQNIYFKDNSYQTNENIYIAIQVLTGYATQGVKDDMGIQEYKERDMDVVQKTLKKMIDLKINDL